MADGEPTGFQPVYDRVRFAAGTVKTQDNQMEFHIKQYIINLGVRCGQPGNRATKLLYLWTKDDPCEQCVWFYIFGWRFGVMTDPFYFLTKEIDNEHGIQLNILEVLRIILFY